MTTSTPEEAGPGTGHTPTPWFAGCQNDALFIVAGRPPALNNDYPWHEAPRVAIAKMLRPSEGDCLPVNSDANAAFIVLAVNSHRELVEALEKAEAEFESIRPFDDLEACCSVPRETDVEDEWAYRLRQDIRRALAKARGAA